MMNPMAPDIYIEEVSGGTRPIQAVGTSTAGFVGEAPDPTRRLNEAVAINNWSQFIRFFVSEGSKSTPLSHAVYGFFQNGGSRCFVVNVGKGGSIAGGGRARVGLDVLEQIDEVAIVAAPGYTDATSYDLVLSHCERLKDRVAILDAPENVEDITLLTQAATAKAQPISGTGHAGATGETKKGNAAEGDDGTTAELGGSRGARPRQSDGGYGAFYFPWITVRDPLSPNDLVDVPPSGHLAGIWARTDATRGVHKAPANEAVRGALNLTYLLTRDEQGILNQSGVNCLRSFAREGIRVWGARTIADGSSEWRYLNVRRLFNMIEESIATSTRWIVFEPNDRTLWKSIRRDLSAFLTRLWRDGALMGRTPQEAFFVKCDEETNPPDTIDAGMVVTVIGIAPVKPAEFIVFRISQHASGLDTETVGGFNA
ncbi:phage tail sheath C-terminal domain-containing protein [Ktedonobacter sp. SOSP1-52]|uniref:phage tail sheath family protein n=1 Tax=Ktedonobacter sp. SOSP1-52 TaxID=2778366 RepID=UPI0019156F08|nr:phage tail sheath C-terminal domain-containing protein [Ktedonobacter sp. SOSP1-52]